MHTTLDGAEAEAFMNLIDWAQYARDIASSNRRKDYDRLIKQLEDGNTLILVCQIEGSTREHHINADDYATYSWLMDQLDDGLSPLVSVIPYTGKMTVEKIP